MIFISLEKISSCFRITSLSSPTKGTASLIDSTTVQWTISELGVTESEGAVLEFTVQHLGTCSGILEVNESISYNDASGNIVTFPSPEINVRCIKFVLPEDVFLETLYTRVTFPLTVSQFPPAFLPHNLLLLLYFLPIT